MSDHPRPSDSQAGSKQTWQLWMDHALALAQQAQSKADIPVGAIVIDGAGKLIAARHNEKEASGNPTAHAEILALSDASRALGQWRCTDATMIVTLEPCIMCAGAIVAARLKRVVFGAWDPKGGACGSLYNVCADPRLNWGVEVVSGVGSEQCGQILAGFFAARRYRSA